MVHIYDKHTAQNAFDTNGIAIINPQSATITEELNGRYDYQLTAVCDPNDDSWRQIRVYNIIKSATTGQLFMIYKVRFDSSGGYPTVTAYANHIWYYLGDMFTKHYEGTRSMYWTLVQLFKDLWTDPDGSTYFSHGTGLTEYTFTYNIDGYDPNTDTKYAKFENVSLAYAILGSPDSVINSWNAELHRDNFEFTIKRPKDASQGIDFEFEYGVNCTNVSYTNDFTDRITELQVYDNYGHFQWLSFVPDAGTFPHQVHVGLALSYDRDDADKFHDDYSDYWNAYCHSTESWEISFVDPSGTDQDAGWSGADVIKIGDICRVKDAVGNTGTQRVISTKINDVTGRLEQIKLGKFVNTAGHLEKYNRLVSGDDAAYRRIKALENAVNP